MRKTPSLAFLLLAAESAKALVLSSSSGVLPRIPQSSAADHPLDGGCGGGRGRRLNRHHHPAFSAEGEPGFTAPRLRDLAALIDTHFTIGQAHLTETRSATTIYGALAQSYSLRGRRCLDGTV